MLLTIMNQKNSYLRNLTETSTEHAYTKREGERETKKRIANIARKQTPVKSI